MDSANTEMNMTPRQQATLEIFTDAIDGLDHWKQGGDNHADEFVFLQSSKWYQESIMGRIGKRGAFYQWTTSDDGKLVEKRQSARITAEVYIR